MPILQILRVCEKHDLINITFTYVSTVSTHFVNKHITRTTVRIRNIANDKSERSSLSMGFFRGKIELIFKSAQS